MQKIGIITYHSAYNFGSMLQATATEQIVEQITKSQVQIINYRMQEQKNIYALYQKGGVKAQLKNALIYLDRKRRKKRENNFELFMKRYMTLSDEVNTPEEVYNLFQNYDILVSGSDQIWNKHSNELENNSWDFMYPYLGKNFTGIKISYASSISNMTDTELNKISADIGEFNYVSAREKSGADRLSNLIHKNVVRVLDPTLLINKEQWSKLLNLNSIQKNNNYILYYSLTGTKTFQRNKEMLKRIAADNNCKVVVISPTLTLQKSSNIFRFHPEVGPKGFLEYLQGALCVITDSFHGTALSVNFHKNFYILNNNGNTDFRKTELLESLGLEDRIVTDNDALQAITEIDYSSSDVKLSKLKDISLKYLREALNKTPSN